MAGENPGNSPTHFPELGLIFINEGPSVVVLRRWKLIPVLWMFGEFHSFFQLADNSF